MSESELERFLAEGETRPEPSDLDYLRGWGIRLRSRIDADLRMSQHTCAIFRPDRFTSKSLTRLSIPYRVIVDQILDHLQFTEDRFADFLAQQGDEWKRVGFARAMDALCRKIEDGVEVIQEDQSKTVAGTITPTDEQQFVAAKQQSALNPPKSGAGSEYLPSIFRKSEDEIWQIRFGKETGQLKGLKGFDHIASLLRCARNPISALEIVGGVDVPSGVKYEEDKVLDQVALKEINEERKQLDAEIEQAKEEQRFDDQERLELKKQELLDEVRKVTHRGKCKQTAVSPIEKARQSVTTNINNAIQKLRDKELRSLADHLDSHIKRGKEFLYSPPDPAPDWIL